MASIDTIPSELGTTPAALASDEASNTQPPGPVWMKVVFGLAIGLLAWGSLNHLFK